MQLTDETFLLFEREPELTGHHQELLTRIAPTAVASTYARASVMVRRPRPWAGFVIGPSVERRVGAEVLSLARRHHPSVPLLVISRASDDARALIERAERLGARHLWAPVLEEDIRTFAEQSIQTRRAQPPLWRRVDEVSLAWKLSACELEILIGALTGQSPEQVAARRAITRNTYKCQVRSLLRKSMARNLDELALSIFRTVLDLTPPQAPALVAPVAASAAPVVTVPRPTLELVRAGARNG